MRRAEERATVLAAIGIHHRLEETASGWAVVVAGKDSARASAALAAYDEENRHAVRVVAPAVGRDAIGLGIAFEHLRGRRDRLRDLIVAARFGASGLE